MAARRWRRTRWTAAAVVAALGITAATGPAASGAPKQTEAVPPGFGGAIAFGARVNPKFAELPLAITVGVSLASHQNTFASAESRAIDLGTIGTTLAGEGCDGGDATLAAEDQPQALRTDSTQEGSADGFTEQEDVPPGTPITKFVRANPTPFGESITTAAPFGVPGVLEVAGIRVTSTSGMVDGQREARAISEVGEVVLGGVVRLAGLRWEAVHRSGSGEELRGTFTLGSASVAGTPIPTQDPVAAISQMNAVLNPIGLNIVPPASRTAPGAGGNIQFVDPIAIEVLPNAARDALTGGVLGGAQPVRENLFAAILEQTCSAATFITVFDVAVGSLTGAGSLALELGGVQAETRAIRFSSTLGGRPTLGGGSVALPGAGATHGTSTRTAAEPAGTRAAPVAAPVGPATPSQPSSAGTASDAAEPIADITNERGGALAAVGATGLLLLLASAEGDRRKMRRAQREIPTEV